MKLSQCIFHFTIYLSSLLAIFLLFSCSSGENDADPVSTHQSATLTFQLEFSHPSSQISKRSASNAIDNTDICIDYQIDTISVHINRPIDGTEVASADGNCSDHSLMVMGVPPGENLLVTCQGVTSNKTEWQGQISGVIAIAGQSTDVGIVQMQYMGNDTSSPEVVSIFPAEGAVDVDLRASTMVFFNEALAPSSIPDQAILVSKDNIPVPGQIDYDPGTYAIRFTPENAEGYEAETTYTLSLSSQDGAGNNITDIAANPFTHNTIFEFTTRGLKDTATPQVIATSPASGAVEVGQQAVIAAIFSEPMAVDSTFDSVFQLSSDQGSVSGQVVYDGDTQTISLTPNFALNTATLYTAVISTEAKDLAQNALSQPHSWQFKTVGPSNHTLTTSKTGNGSGRVTCEPSNIDCGGTCEAEVMAGTDVTLTATADAGSVFTGWSGDRCDGDTGDCTFSMSEAVIVSASFALRTYTISASANPEDGSRGSVTPTTASVTHGDDHLITIQPQPFHSLSNLILDGELMAPAASHLFENVTADHTILAIFQSNKSNISNNSNLNDTEPQINARGHVVWIGGNEVFYYDGSSKTNISNYPSVSVTGPQINADGYIVWLGHTVSTAIYYWDKLNVLPITSTPGDSVSYGFPQINDNGQVVFTRDSNLGSSDQEVVFYDINNGGSPSTISDIIGSRPRINSTAHVIWSCRTNDICFFDGSAVSRLSDVDPDLPDNNPLHPEINSDGDVVWSSNSEIYYYDGSTIINISNNSASVDLYPQINSHGQVVWEGGGEIYYYDGSTAVNISNSSSVEDHSPKINTNGHVVWHGSDGVDNEIYYYDGSSVFNISNDTATDDQTPQINANGQVVWAGSDSNSLDVDIYMNHP